MKRSLLLVVALVAVATWVARTHHVATPVSAAAAQDGKAAKAAKDDGLVPYFEPDPGFPRPLPNNLAYGAVVGIAVDPKDRVWLIHRPSMMTRERNAADGVSSYCCYPAPPVIVYDAAGNFVKAWGPIRNAPSGDGPPSERGGEITDPRWKGHWPQSEHGLHIDDKGFVWTGGNGQKDSRILKFDEDGKFLMQIGNYEPYGRKGPGHDGGPDSNDLKNFNKPSTMVVDPTTNEVYVSDGYGNRRVIVFDADTGAYKRHWGAYGNPPDDKDPYNATRGGTDKTYDPTIASKQFGRAVHGAALSRDGHVYVADRTNHRVQAFTTAGRFVGEVFTDRRARGTGAAGAVAVSPDQKWLYVCDSQNSRIWIIRRSDLKKVGYFGTASGYPGGLFAVHDIDVDSKGNVYTGETLTGRRVQRFLYKGLRPAPTQDWVD